MKERGRFSAKPAKAASALALAYRHKHSNNWTDSKKASNYTDKNTELSL